MSLYLLKRPGNDVGWDEADGFVVCASSEETARIVASQECGDEGPQAWLDEAKSTCEKIVRTDYYGTVLRSFRAG